MQYSLDMTNPIRCLLLHRPVAVVGAAGSREVKEAQGRVLVGFAICSDAVCGALFDIQPGRRLHRIGQGSICLVVHVGPDGETSRKNEIETRLRATQGRQGAFGNTRAVSKFQTELWRLTRPPCLPHRAPRPTHTQPLRVSFSASFTRNEDAPRVILNHQDHA